MIKVATFFNDTAAEIGADIETYINRWNIKREQIITITHTSNITCHTALLVYEEK